MARPPGDVGAAPIDSRFLHVAARHGMLSAEAVGALSSEAAQRGLTPSQLVVEKGLMDLAQVEIVETLSRPDDAIPGYEIIDVLGRGGMGIVYRARQKNLDRIVALKTILVSQMTQPGMLARFEKEAVTSAQLRHPNIVAAYDFGRYQGRLYFAMELVDGDELGKVIDRRGRLSEATAWGLARQVASGLAHAAKAGVVHRDVKPANVLLVPPPEGFALPAGLPMVKITDFGLAILAREAGGGDRLTVAGSTLGTPRYMAPEQLEGSDVDYRADIYALGATVYHMLCGQPPFNDQTLQAVITSKLRGEAPRVSEVVPTVSVAGAELVADMMARDLARRVPDYAALLSRIDHVVAGMPRGVDSLTETQAFPIIDPLAVTEAVPVVNPAPNGPSAGRSVWRPWALGAIAASLLVVGGMMIVAPWISSHRADPSAGYVPGTWTEYLFDGTTLRGWTVIHGQWLLDVDDEGGRILSGKGASSRLLRREPPLNGYRLTLAVALRTATAVELQFALSPPNNGQSSRYALRLEPDRVLVGRRSTDDGAIEPLSPPLPVAEGPGSDGQTVWHELRVERHGNQWRAFCDGTQVAVLPIQEENRTAEMRLVTEGGGAWFDAVQVTEMVPPPASIKPE